MSDWTGRTRRWVYRFRSKYDVLWQVALGCLGLIVISVIGIVGYMLIEGWNVVDSFYMVVITLATVGYQEVHPMGDVARLWTAFLILGGVGSFMYIASMFFQLLVEGRLQRILARRRVRKMISSLDGHFIVCGYGRIGSIVVEQLTKENYPVVVVEKDQDLIDSLRTEGILCISGDATSDETLEAAGLDKARSLITALSHEASNVYVTLTARQLNPNLTIIARADNRAHIQRLKRAGADRVVMPHIIGGMRMAQSVLRPSVTNLLELAMQGTVELEMEEHVVGPSSELVGKNLIESEIRPRFNVIIIGIRKVDGEMVFNPDAHFVISSGDTLVTVGKHESMVKLREISGTNGHSL
ncbi:MAG: potassium channel family protein [Desulfovibrio sp.]|uniref:potassium channel family protein n=1 Tax=Desulfovibrio sp. 7SRBS1 TaxID=3378064 RepID=UPI003B3CFA35